MTERLARVQNRINKSTAGNFVSKWIETDGETLKKGFRTSAGSKPFTKLSQLEKYKEKTVDRRRLARVAAVDTMANIMSGGGQRVPIITALLSLMLFFSGLTQQGFAFTNLLGWTASYKWCFSLAYAISFVMDSLVIPAYLRGVGLPRNRVLLVNADNFVKISRNAIPGSEDGLIKAVATIMFAFLWIKIIGGSDDDTAMDGAGEETKSPEPEPQYATLDIGARDPAKPLNPPFDESAETRIVALLDHPDVKRLANGEMVPYPAIFSLDDLQSKVDAMPDPSTDDYVVHNRPGQFGRHATFFPLVLAWVLAAVTFGGAASIVVVLFDQEGAWVMEKAAAGAVAGLAANSVAWIIVSYAIFHAQKNLLETNV